MAQNKKILEANKRVVINVLDIVSEEEVGRNKAIKLSFNAIHDGQTLKHASFIKSLFPSIKAHVGKGMDCEVEISEHEYDGRMYQDYLILQVFVDGKAMRSKDDKGGGGQGGGGRAWQPDPPEKIASIEAQTIFNGITAALVAKIILLNSDLGKMWQAWAKQGFEISQRLRNAPAPAKTLIEEAKAMGTTEAESEEIDWGEAGVKIDTDALKELMTASKWSDTTIKTWCKSTVKTDANGQPLDTKLELVPFIRSMTSENIEKLFKLMESKRA